MKDFANKQQWGTREDRKRPTACVRSITEGCGFQGSSAVCIPTCILLKTIKGQQHASPHLSKSSEHTSHIDTCLRQLVSATFQLGPDPSSGGQMAACMAFEALEQHCWAAGNTPCLLTAARQLRKENSAAHQIVPAALLPRLESQQRPSLHGISSAALSLFLLNALNLEECFSLQQIGSCVTRADEIMF